MDGILRDRLSMVAALGAGVVVGISGIYLYYKVNKCVSRELNQLTGTIDSLRREIEELKTSSNFTREKIKSSPNRKAHSSNNLAAKKYFTGYTSSSVEDADEEYFDFTDTEEVIETWVNGPDVVVSKCSDDDWFEELDELLDSESVDKESLYLTITAKKEEYSENSDFLWRLAKVTHLYGIAAQNRGDMEKRKQLVFEASEYAKRAYELKKDNPEVHKWCAITIGSLGDFVGVQEKIMNGFIFKEHVDKAIGLKPMDPTLYYMLGRWCYEVAMLSWLERKVASTLFSSPPEATLVEARTLLMKADELKPNWKENVLFIAKTYIGEGDYSNAISQIDKAMELPVNGDDDAMAHSELKTLQYKYQTYRAS